MSIGFDGQTPQARAKPHRLLMLQLAYVSLKYTHLR